jgi:ribosomal protein S18 acetylase RimI-like enzyme
MTTHEVPVTVEKATTAHVSACVDALRDSEIGARYFPTHEAMVRFIHDGIARGELHVALDAHNQCQGYAWFMLQGAFGRFPYLKNIAVRRAMRGKGVGRQLLSCCEAEGFAHARHVFLLVSDFNESARRLYERLGYVQVGMIPDLIVAGVGECVMM